MDSKRLGNWFPSVAMGYHCCNSFYFYIKPQRDKIRQYKSEVCNSF